MKGSYSKHGRFRKGIEAVYVLHLCVMQYYEECFPGVSCAIVYERCVFFCLSNGVFVSWVRSCRKNNSKKVCWKFGLYWIKVVILHSLSGTKGVKLRGTEG